MEEDVWQHREVTKNSDLLMTKHTYDCKLPIYSLHLLISLFYHSMVWKDIFPISFIICVHNYVPLWTMFMLSQGLSQQIAYSVRYFLWRLVCCFTFCSGKKKKMHSDSIAYTVQMLHHSGSTACSLFIGSKTYLLRNCGRRLISLHKCFQNYCAGQTTSS